MIRWSSFLKSFVLWLFTLWISCFIFWVGSSVSAIFSQNTYYYYYDTRFPTIHDNYTYYVGSNWSFKTDYWDYSTNSFFWVADWWTYSTFNFGWLDWRLYFSQYYWNNSSVQWYLQNWCISPVSSRLSNWKNLHSDCVFDKSINDIKEIMLPFTDYAFESVGWSSPEITNNSSSPFMFCLSDSLFDYCVSCSVWNCPSGITWSLNYNLSSFSNVRWVNFTPSPFFVNYVSTSTWVNATLTWNLVYSDWKTCTYWQVMDYLEWFWYSKYLCYWWLNNWNNFDASLSYNPTPWTWYTLDEIYWHVGGAWDSAFDWFSFWNWLYSEDKSKYTSMWESYPAVMRTWFDLYYQYGGPSATTFEWLYEYCLMNKFLSWGSVSRDTVYKWTVFKNSCTSISNGSQIWYDWENWNPTAIDWQNFGWNGSFGGGSWLTSNQNWSTFISNFYNKLKFSYRIPEASSFWFWIIPSYIVWAMVWLILFRFIKSK